MQLTAELLLLLCAISALVIGSAVRQMLHGKKLPYTVALMLVGLLLGGLDRSGLLREIDPVSNQMVSYIATMEPHLILALFLPILIFESAFNMEPHLFKRLFPQISLLAVPGLIIATVLTAWACRMFLPWQWSWTEALLFGALISATDPVAVVALLKELGAPKRLETLLEGESLLNDGTAIVIFLLFLGLLQPGAAMSGMTLVDFVVVAIGGGVLGWLIGRLFLIWMRRLQQDPLAQISLSVVSAFFCYMLAEVVLHLSGVVAVVALGLTLATHIALWLPNKVIRFLDQFWHLLAHVANTLAFLLVGITIAVNIPLDDKLSWGLIPWVYLIVMLVRTITVALLYPVLKKMPGGFRLDKAIVLVWGSLRGAVALVLALSLMHAPSLSDERGHQILFLTAGVVSLTLLINAATMRHLCQWLKLDRLSPAKQAAMDHACGLLNQATLASAAELKNNPHLRLSNWPRIEQQLGIQQTHELGTPTDREALFRQLLEAERQLYWQQYHQGYLSRSALHKLLQALDLALDGKPQLNHHQILDQLTKPPLWHRLISQLPGWQNNTLALGQQRLRLQYGMARGFVQAQQDLQILLPTLSPPAEIANEAMHLLHENQRQLEFRLAALEQHYPALCRALQTHISQRVLLNNRAETIEKLASQGLLESGEREKLLTDNQMKKAQLQHFKLPSLHENQLQQLQQLESLQKWPIEHLQSLLRHGQHRLIDEGELLFNEKSRSCWLLLLAGTVQVFDTDKGHITDISAKGAGVQLGQDPATPTPCTNRAKAICAVEVLSFDQQQWQAMAKEYPVLIKRLLNLPK
ncbi:cation:proton antiporter [Corallincola spongiicola]|uniref:Cation/H+ exchanger transmembrane domain-containing protein n=1 Tax=Corallincola spongiicola TaxID=2520508 RepID=A0ABY1WL75_9GAMM|nr:cation:proton antiporter [Corallincola spongiicola]TAA40988.1 hypothetical protein EXY25_16930 [Corallincola spongiicola]